MTARLPEAKIADFIFYGLASTDQYCGNCFQKEVFPVPSPFGAAISKKML
jgi:hypothetical protein